MQLNHLLLVQGLLGQNHRHKPMSTLRDRIRILGRTANSNTDRLPCLTEVDGSTTVIKGLSKVSSFDLLSELLNYDADSSERAYVKENNTLYFWDGDDWNNIGLLNTSISLSLDSDQYYINPSQTSTTITATGVDPEEVPLTYNIEFSPSNIVDSAIDYSLNGNVFTISKKEGASGIKTADISVSASDGVNVAIDTATLNITIESIVSINRSHSSINEGSSVTFTLNTLGYTNGSTIPYTITGVTSADINGASLTGNFTVNNNQATLVLTATEDQLSEGTETITVSVDEGNNGSASNTCSISDTSRAITYDWYSFSSFGPNEGDTFTFTARVYNSSETMYWSFSGTNDMSPSSGTLSPGTLTQQGDDYYYNHFGTATVTADLTTEGNETFTLYLRSNSTSGTSRDTQSITIQDTSTTPHNVQASADTLSNTGIGVSEKFGQRVAIGTDDTHMLVSAYADNTNSGSVYYYQNRVYQSTITAPTSGTYGKNRTDCRFGSSLKMNPQGTRAIIGAHAEDGGSVNYSGAAWLAYRSGTTWFFANKLEPNDPQQVGNMAYDTSVGMSDDGLRYIVGAYNVDSTTNNGGGKYGAAYIFEGTSLSGVTQRVKIQSPGADDTWPPTNWYHWFGMSCDMSGDGERVVISAPRQDTTEGIDSGVVYVYRRNSISSWSLEATLLDTLLQSSSYAGDREVTINSDGSYIAYGAANNGRVFIWTRSGTTWTRQAVVTGSNHFGYKLNISNDGTKLACMEWNATAGSQPYAGLVKVFTRSGTTWTLEETLQSPIPRDRGRFGHGIQFSGDGNHLLVGESQDANSVYPGEAHVFDLVP